MSLRDFKDYFYHRHDVEVNQKYNKTLPYSFHLDMVEKQGIKFKHLIDSSNEAIWIGIYGHDSIEDARMTYNDLIVLCGTEAAEIIFLCTEDKGRNRADRKSDVWYNQLVKNKEAVFVKLCDIIANVKFSLLTNSSMYFKYKSEYTQKVRPMLYCKEYKEMFEYLDKLLSMED